MKRILTVFLLTLLLAACSMPQVTATPPPVGAGPETGSPEPVDSSTLEIVTLPLPAATLQTADGPNMYRVTNPTSGAKLHVRAFYPTSWNGTDLLPALLLMPGGISTSEPQKAARLSEEGYLVIIFDADGRGQSEGTEDYNGFITQDGLAAVIVAAAQLPGLDPARYGLVSYSYGVTAASGALARYPDLPVKFYIDWEGPVDRFYTTSGCGEPRPEGIQWQPCADNDWWAEREAVNFIAAVEIPYQRIQSQEDHVQPNNNHAIDIVNAAVAGGVPWVRLNDYPPNQTYDKNTPPAMLPETQDKMLEKTVGDYARYILENVLPTMP